MTDTGAVRVLTGMRQHRERVSVPWGHPWARELEKTEC